MLIDRMDDTICAVSTPHGVGGIAVIRVSGNDALEIVGRMWRGRRLTGTASHTAHLGNIINDEGEILDQCVATVFRSPNSFTGEDVVELSVHGSAWIQRQVINNLIKNGCRLAMPGEFTRRAFAAGKMDLAEAEGVADLIAAGSRAAHRLAVSQMRGHFSSRLHELRDRLLELASLLELELDFSEEEVEFASRDKLKSIAEDILSLTRRLADSFEKGSAIKEGIPVAIVGATNAGKSTILNQLLHEDRAIVSDIHGTTRDTIEDVMEIGGATFRIIDTAGLRQTSDQVEALGIERALTVLDKAKVVVWVIDSSAPDATEVVWQRIAKRLTDSHSLIIALNKVDISNNKSDDDMLSRIDTDKEITASHPKIVHLVAREGKGISELEQAMLSASGIDELDETDVIVTNARHFEALNNASEALQRVLEGLRSDLSGDFIAQDIRLAVHHLGEITGEITTHEILTTIFSRFCIGK
ncbi:MAG: tRNA uridine-5-carboxymethylaminomethyl(34) synthesis GTPase MnmE [Muribaculum sp.]|nr:tRNA uridine-5-carboxymethylaminomethyl(34) synthesis GTPase MnmE [Muribaculum sp.]